MSDRSFAIEFDRDAIEEFCRKWRIKEFALFGSILTDEFRPDSDEGSISWKRSWSGIRSGVTTS